MLASAVAAHAPPLPCAPFFPLAMTHMHEIEWQFSHNADRARIKQQIYARAHISTLADFEFKINTARYRAKSNAFEYSDVKCTRSNERRARNSTVARVRRPEAGAHYVQECLLPQHLSTWFLLMTTASGSSSGREGKEGKGARLTVPPRSRSERVEEPPPRKNCSARRRRFP